MGPTLQRCKWKKKLCQWSCNPEMCSVYPEDLQKNQKIKNNSDFKKRNYFGYKEENDSKVLRMIQIEFAIEISLLIHGFYSNTLKKRSSMFCDVFWKRQMSKCLFNESKLKLKFYIVDFRKKLTFLFFCSCSFPSEIIGRFFKYSFLVHCDFEYVVHKC